MELWGYVHQSTCITPTPSHTHTSFRLQVRKAYKRLALQMHPDKAASSCRYSCQLGEGGAVVLSVAAAQGRLQEDAKWLFQCLGESLGAGFAKRLLLLLG